MAMSWLHDTYQKIAQHFSNTRAYLWKSVKEFLNKIESNSVILEVGCGNGKYLRAFQDRTDVVAIGCDITPYFVARSQSDRIDTFQATNMALPVRSGIADLVMSVAVLHHFDSAARRLQALEELLRLVRPGGRILIQVWALEQQPGSRRTFHQADNLVGWNNPDKTMFRQRYYHVFHQGELEALLQQSPRFCQDFILTKNWYEMGNWAVVLTRKK